MKVVIPTIPTLLSLSALLSVSAATDREAKAKGMIRRNTGQEEDSLEPEVADIINGTPTGNPFPYQVALSFVPNEGPNCGGSLIASRVVLTAAHCYIDGDGKPRNPAFGNVRLNMYDWADLNNPGVISINLSQAKIGYDIFPHPGYNPATMENDVALVILPGGQEEGDNIRYAKLNKDPNVPVADNRLYASGWGRTEVGGDRSQILLGTVINYVPNDECTTWLGCPTSTNVCTAIYNNEVLCAYKEGTGTCQGDSGGPVVIASQNETAPANEPPLQVGITSYGFACATSGYPSGYTRVSTYVDWITSKACEVVGQLCASSKSGKSPKSSKSQRSSSKSAEEDVVVVHDQEGV